MINIGRIENGHGGSWGAARSALPAGFAIGAPPVLRSHSSCPSRHTETVERGNAGGGKGLVFGFLLSIGVWAGIGAAFVLYA